MTVVGHSWNQSWCKRVRFSVHFLNTVCFSKHMGVSIAAGNREWSPVPWSRFVVPEMESGTRHGTMQFGPETRPVPGLSVLSNCNYCRAGKQRTAAHSLPPPYGFPDSSFLRTRHWLMLINRSSRWGGDDSVFHGFLSPSISTVPGSPYRNWWDRVPNVK
jgi:hypothetical protein